MATLTHLPLGALPLGSGVAEFRVWAPLARSLAVRVGGGATRALAAVEDGFWAGEAAPSSGDDYRLLLDDRVEWPDPCSRWQPEGGLPFQRRSRA